MIEKFRKSVEDFVYEEVDQLQIIESTKDSQMLYVLMYNYNWDDGFEVPLKAIENKYCELSTALMIFYMADGMEYLFNKNEEEYDEKDEWYIFITKLYEDIIKRKFLEGDILFDPELSRAENFKLKKVLKPNEYIFIEPRGNIDLNINY